MKKQCRDPLSLCFIFLIKCKNDLPSVKSPNRNHGDDKKIRSIVIVITECVQTLFIYRIHIL